MRQIQPSKIEYNIDQAMPFGDMPSAMLTSKFDETNLDIDENMAYNDYARNTLTNWGPDTNKFEYEEPRGAVNRAAGRIQLQYYGHRGEADDPYRPEIFDGFMGEEDRDPRGINTDPDFKEVRKQHESRTRFIRFSADDSNHITGGGRSEAKTMADQQTLFKTVRNRLKVFDRQLDGRREGLRRTYPHKSNAAKQIIVQSYGDSIKDQALCPQKRAHIISNQILRATRAWQDETADGDFAVAKYTQLCKTKKPEQHNRVTSHLHDTKFAAADITQCYKSAGLLMAHIVHGKRSCMELVKQSDMDFSEARHTAIRKIAPFTRDLAVILKAIEIDNIPKDQDETLFGKTPDLVIADHMIRQIVHNHLTPAHQQLNSEILYKSLRHDNDTRKVKDLVITDSTHPIIRDLNTPGSKSAQVRRITGMKLNTADDSDKSESANTFNYRVARLTVNLRDRAMANDGRASESDDSQFRKQNEQNYRVTGKDKICTYDTAALFGDNASKERHIGVLGGKYLTRHIDRDARSNEISASA